MAQATIQLGGLVGQVRTIVQEATQALAAAIARKCSPARDIDGIRNLALDHADALWPMLHPSTNGNNADDSIPEFSIIVFGTVPEVRAEIVYQDRITNRNIIFVRGPTHVSAEAAVEGLLETTMVAIDQQYTAHVFRGPALRWTSARLPHATGSGWYCQRWAFGVRGRGCDVVPRFGPRTGTMM